MHLILDTIEFPRCEGRLINRDIFVSIDIMDSDIQHNKDVQLSDWQDTIEQFGEYYQLDGNIPIEILQRSLDEMAYMANNFNVPLSDES